MAEETKETVDFYCKLQDFFLHDDQSRWKAIGWTVAIAGSLGTVNLVFLGSSVDDTVFLMGAAILLMSVFWIGWYCSFRQQQPQETPFMSRRALVLQAATFIAFLASLRLPRAEARIIERKLQEMTDNPANPQNILDATQLIATAKAERIRVRPSVIGYAGKKFVKIANDDPVAWNATLAFLDYRSFLNADFVPSLGHLTPATGKSKYLFSIGTKPNPDYSGTQKAFTVFTAGGYSTPDKAARMEKLDAPEPSGSEFAFVVIEGGVDAVVLDGEYLKHVIIRNSDIVYDGGPLRLEDVYFVNCTFHSSFKLTPRSIELSQQILAAANVSFTTTG